MKKSLLALLLAVAMVVPVFAAEKGDMEIVGKLGVAVNPTIVWCYGEDEGDSFGGYNKNPALSIAVEGLYYIFPELPIGLGLNYQFDSDLSGTWSGLKSSESGVTNIYLTVKPTAKIDSKIFTALYAIGQIGYGLNRVDMSGKWIDEPVYYKYDVDSNGLYWGLGAGTEIMNDFVFEFVFSTNYWSSKYENTSYSSPEICDMKSTALTFFAGYKFNI